MNLHADIRTRSPALATRIALGLTLSLASFATALGQDLPEDQSTEQGHTQMDQINLANPEGELVAPEAPKETSPFIRDSKWSAQARSFYFDRDKYDGSISEAWAVGGSVTYLSGYVGDVFRIGATGYTSLPLYAPTDKDGTGLLLPGQEGYAVLGQLYGEFKFTDKIFAAIGAKTYNTPYINANDVRMTPNTFEGATFYGTAGEGDSKFRFGGGYISKIKQKNDDEFVPMSEAAGVSGVDRGVYVLGGNYLVGDFSIGAAEYYSDDILKIFYAESKYAFKFGDAAKLSLAAQYSDQQSTGDDLLTGSSFNTNQWGVKGDLTFGGAGLLTLAYTDTSNGDQNMRAPWSGYPGYTSVQVKDFNRANEQATMIKGLYDFSKLGASGFSAYLLYVHGSGVNAPNYNEDETDLNVQWNVKTGALRGLSFRLRYAYIEQRGGGDPNINDLRFIVNYDFPRPGN